MLIHVGSTTFGMMTLSITALCLRTLIIRTVGIATLSKINLNVTETKQQALKSVSNCWNIHTYSYLEASGGQSSDFYLYFVLFFRHQC
jgi:hypothetical protein